MAEIDEAIALLKIGDLNGLKPIVLAHYMKAARTVYLVLGNKSNAEEIARVAFLQAAEQIRKLKETSFEHWFFTILINRTLKHLKQQKPKRMKESQPQDPDTESTPHFWDEDTILPDSPGEPDLSSAAWQALQALSPKQRAAVVEKYYLEIPGQEFNEAANLHSIMIKRQLLAQLAEEQIPPVADCWDNMQFKILAADAARPRYPLGVRLGFILLSLIGISVFTSVIFLLTSSSNVHLKQLLQKIINDPDPANSLSTPLNTATVMIIASPTQVPTTGNTFPSTRSTDSKSVSGSNGYMLSFYANPAGTPIPFEIIVPSILPPGYRGTSLIMDGSTASITHIYRYEPAQANEMVILTQSQTEFPLAVGLSPLIETNSFAEITVMQVDAGSQHLESLDFDIHALEGVLQTFRWQMSDYTFTLTIYTNDPLSPATLDDTQIQSILQQLLEH